MTDFLLDTDILSIFAKAEALSLLCRLFQCERLPLTSGVFDELLIPLEYGYDFPPREQRGRGAKEQRRQGDKEKGRKEKSPCLPLSQAPWHLGTSAQDALYAQGREVERVLNGYINYLKLQMHKAKRGKVETALRFFLFPLHPL